MLCRGPHGVKEAPRSPGASPLRRRSEPAPPPRMSNASQALHYQQRPNDVARPAGPTFLRVTEPSGTRSAAVRPGAPERPTAGRAVLVAKVGGSLFDLEDLGPRLRGWLARQPEGEKLLVPGGGPAAAGVRARDRAHLL